MSKARTGKTWKPPLDTENVSAPTEAWQSQALVTARPPRPWNRLGWAFSGLLLFAGFISLLVYVSLWLSPAKGTYLVLVSAGYEDNLAVPHNIYGRNGLKALSEFAKSRYSGGLRLQEQPSYKLNDLEYWDKGLSNFPEKNVIVFFSLNGGADRKGAYLLPQRAQMPIEPDSLDADQNRLRLETVLDRLAELPRNRHVVLILDATQITADWHLGMVHNSFAKELENLNQRIKEIPNLIVLSASGPDQKSWVSEELGRTIFSHYILKGLQGHADADQDSRVSALELHNYVSLNVERWAAVNRGALQTPVMYPLGNEGKERAERIKLVVVKKTPSTEPDEGAPYNGSEDLNTAWKECAKLEQQIPHPGVYNPALWRQYRDLLLRYEQLVVAGEKDSAASLAVSLGNLHQEISQRKELPLDFSLQNSLGLPLAAGYRFGDPLPLAKQVVKLWTAKKLEEEKSILETIQKDFSSPTQTVSNTLLRVQLLQMLLEQTAADPTPPLEKTFQLLKRIVQNAPADPLPAEAHFLVMLKKDLPQVPLPKDSALKPEGSKEPAKILLSAADLQLALRVRLLAEQSALALVGYKGHPYSEHVFPWIKKQIEQADEKRRWGEDLLFATAPADLKKARDFLVEAQNLYNGIFTSKEGETPLGPAIRQAMQVRDRVIPMLPYYSLWLANRYSGGIDKQHLENQLLREKMVELGRQTHELVKLLEETPATLAKAEDPSKANASFLKNLISKTQKVQEGFALIEGKFEETLKKLEAQPDPANWREIDAALSVPFAKTTIRQELLTKRSLIAKQLLQRLAKQPSSWPKLSAVDNALRAKKQAGFQAQLALSLLGDRWFEDNTDDKHETLDQVQFRLKNFEVLDNWNNELKVIGEEIGWRWQRFPGTIAKLFKKEYKATPEQFYANLQKADRLLRFMDGAGSIFLTKLPSPTYRQLQMQHLLVWQTHRTYQDHWFGEQEGHVYFQEAGEAYLKDAEKWFAQSPALLAMRDELKRSGKLQLRLFSAPGVPGDDNAPLSETLHLTTEREFPLKYRLLPMNKNAAPPSGYPVVWMEAGPLLKPAQGEELSRQMAFVSEDSKTLVGASFANPLLGQKKPAVPKALQTYFSIECLFRGQKVKQITDIQLHPLAQMIKVSHPLPVMASVAVRSPKPVQEVWGFSTGHVAIVLDCSGSMGPPEGVTDLANTKWSEATDAVAQLLTTIPKGTTLSIWSFGQALPDVPTAKEAEQTIRRILSPVKWDPQNAGQVQKVIADIKGLNPWNESPLIRTMLHAVREDLAKAQGFKSLLVITDGMDNRIQKDPEFNPDKKDVSTLLLENFRDTEVNIIGFKIDSKEQAKAAEQFSVIKDLPLGGNYYDIQDSGQLVFTLKKVLRTNLRYWVDRIDDYPIIGFPSEGLDVSLTGSNEKWVPGGLYPGNYKVRVHTNKRNTQAFALSKGDILLFDFVPFKKLGGPGDLLGFQRVLFSQVEFPGQPKAAPFNSNWLMALLQNERKPNGAVQMLVTLEKKNDFQTPVMQQIKPRETWVEIATADENDNFSQRWHYQPGYPAPAWSVDIPQWPQRKLIGGAISSAPAKPVVRAWFSPDQPVKGLLLERAHAFGSPFDLKNQRVTVANQSVVIESVLLEDNIVETKYPNPTQPAKVGLQSCLVVRISYAKNNPVWVRLNGLVLGGEEHHFFTKANKYTGIFWPVTREQANEILKSIEVISLSDLKQQAVQYNDFLEINDVYEPRASDKRPHSPVDLLSLVTPEPPTEEIIEPSPTKPLAADQETPKFPSIPVEPVPVKTEPMAPQPMTEAEPPVLPQPKIVPPPAPQRKSPESRKSITPEPVIPIIPSPKVFPMPIPATQVPLEKPQLDEPSLPQLPYQKPSAWPTPSLQKLQPTSPKKAPDRFSVFKISHKQPETSPSTWTAGSSPVSTKVNTLEANDPACAPTPVLQRFSFFGNRPWLHLKSKEDSYRKMPNSPSK